MSGNIPRAVRVGWACVYGRGPALRNGGVPLLS